ncbi:NADH:flavin oxidoreductase/NADH oxidase [Hyaloscypha variabilis F]|uniref:NADH:flavin oxidoreductase/NADH oxidase n=1 Tax=Hyaloscypha variabilis (strain UAMH 11265 / GT02V1 / F) TaxID=1149755 RepID=A0A2J6REA7_HYAVF|nr:NADH:flavin oxidoreductase/NADH oxidase [Hyaloscypha variabilis F]
MVSNLFKPLQVGTLQLQNRIALAPLTRYRADAAHVPLPFVAEYYAQRAAVPGTLLITEATYISPESSGYGLLPGIYNDAQIAAWKKVTSAVHAKGSFIYMQLWALGRAAEPETLEEEFGKGVVKFGSSSDVPLYGNTPEPYTEEEIWKFVRDYAQAAKNAIEAGFDGVEIHGANGYLIDQFTQDTCNKRTDAWGGNVEKRARFAIEIVKAVVEAVGADKTGIRLSPYSELQGMRMRDPIPGFSYLLDELKKFKLAYLHLVVVSRKSDTTHEVEATANVDPMINVWGKTSPVILTGGFNAQSAKRVVDEEYKDKDIIIGFGRYFISNPDIVFRIREGIELTPLSRRSSTTRERRMDILPIRIVKPSIPPGKLRSLARVMMLQE